jgi:hypothetical protein
MRDYSNCKLSPIAYGGYSCNKVGIVDDGKYYLVKFPNKLKGKHIKNVEISYANDVFSEYIASAVMHMFMPAHKVSLGLYDGKICSICEDFTSHGARLSKYSELKMTMRDAKLTPSGDISSPDCSELEDVRYVLTLHPIVSHIPDIYSKFWTMFIVDALNGNPDRNNDNWGILSMGSSVEFAPVYDNGNSLNSKLSDEQMTELLHDKARLKAAAYSGFRCFFTNETSRINPYHLLESGEYLEAIQTVLSMDFNCVEKIADIIDRVPDISEERKQFYVTIYAMRIEELKRLQNFFG